MSLSVLRTLIVFFALSGIARGQSPVEVGFGVRGGLLLNKSFQGNQNCLAIECTISTPNNLFETAGPSVNVLLYNRLELRFEAVHRRFESQVKNDTIILPFSQNGSETVTVETTQGKLWEYPLLATYHFLSGPIRPYAGGGLSLGITGSRNTETVITTTLLPQSGVPPAPTTTVLRSSGSLSSWAPYYLVAGIDGRISHISIKPEFRYSHSFADQAVSEQVLLKPNQFEFLVGVSVEFGLKKLGTHR